MLLLLLLLLLLDVLGCVREPLLLLPGQPLGRNLLLLAARD